MKGSALCTNTTIREKVYDIFIYIFVFKVEENEGYIELETV